jgi:hypothetical protein
MRWNGLHRGRDGVKDKLAALVTCSDLDTIARSLGPSPGSPGSAARSLPAWSMAQASVKRSLTSSPVVIPCLVVIHFPMPDFSAQEQTDSFLDLALLCVAGRARERRRKAQQFRDVPIKRTDSHSRVAQAPPSCRENRAPGCLCWALGDRLTPLRRPPSRPSETRRAAPAAEPGAPAAWRWPHPPHT